MAIRIHPPSSLTISASLKRKEKTSGKGNSTFCPVRTAEDLASLLGREITAAGLDRLLRHSPPPPVPSTPSNPIRVAYQGARGSYCQEAAAAAFPSAAGQPCPHMEEAFASLEDGSADRAVVPLENSLDGPIPRNLDLLLRHPGVRISGELLLSVNHCLLSHPSAPPAALRRVVSHPQALAHCSARLRQLGLAVEEVPCAAAAASLLAEDAITDTAVIGSRMAAREYGLNVLEENLQDRMPAGNFTRFLQLALGPTKHVGPALQKSTVAFSLRKGPSDMFQAMWVFESRGVRVTRVDHRPNRSRPVRIEPDRKKVCMDYVFVLDVEGRTADVEAALGRLEEIAESVRTLGIYATCA